MAADSEDFWKVKFSELHEARETFGEVYGKVLSMQWHKFLERRG